MVLYLKSYENCHKISIFVPRMKSCTAKRNWKSQYLTSTYSTLIESSNDSQKGHSTIPENEPTQKDEILQKTLWPLVGTCRTTMLFIAYQTWYRLWLASEWKLLDNTTSDRVERFSRSILSDNATRSLVPSQYKETIVRETASRYLSCYSTIYSIPNMV